MRREQRHVKRGDTAGDCRREGLCIQAHQKKKEWGDSESRDTCTAIVVLACVVFPEKKAKKPFVGGCQALPRRRPGDVFANIISNFNTGNVQIPASPVRRLSLQLLFLANYAVLRLVYVSFALLHPLLPTCSDAWA